MNTTLFSLSRSIHGGAADVPQVEPAFDVILVWRTMYATNAHSHECAPGAAAESLVHVIDHDQGQSEVLTTRPRGPRLGLISPATSDLSQAAICQPATFDKNRNRSIDRPPALET